MERFMGILIEHFAGAFPLWLAPEQVRVLPISDKAAEYANQVLARLLGAGFRATLDTRPEKIGAKIRDAQLEKVPVMLVVGAKEAENQSVSYRDRQAGDLGAMPLHEAIARLKTEAESRRAPKATPLPAAPPAEEKAEDHTY
jgi:threonyl-tRNA synthetase